MQHPAIAVVGGSGFVGRAVVEAFTAAGNTVVTVTAPRLEVADGTDPVVAGRAWADAEHDRFAELVAALAGCAVVVNAAGDASPTSAASSALWGANAVLPVVVALAADAAGAARVVHVSSAAVQGSRAVLDETPFERGHSPYARSKGAGESGLLAPSNELSPRVVVYRPTSVMGAERPIAQRLASVLSSKWMMVPAPDAPLPVAHVEHVGQAVAKLATVADPPSIVLHPWEGMTVASLAAALGRPGPLRRLPKLLAFPLVKLVTLLAKGGPLAGQARRIELLWVGQGQRSSMPELGFQLDDPELAYQRLGEQLAVHSPE